MAEQSSYRTACLGCGRRLPADAFSKRQLASWRTAKCKECVAAAASAEAAAAASKSSAASEAEATARCCSGCGKSLPSAAFSRTQLCQKTDETRRCLGCVASLASGGSGSSSDLLADSPAPAAALAAAPSGLGTAPPLCAAVEMARLKATKGLRRLLTTLCEKRGGAPPVLAFDRWVARGMLAEHLEGSPGGEPLLPARAEADKAMVKDLCRVLEQPAASEIAAEMAAAAAAAAARLARLASEAGAEAGAEAEVLVEERGEMVRLSLASAPKPYVEVQRGHFDKLTALHARHAQPGASLRARAFCMLLRYSALGAHGYQAALPPSGFEVLHRRLGCSLEVFASPLNARYGRYCSAFADVDAPFGSLGSFYSFRPSEGSYEANPCRRRALFD